MKRLLLFVALLCVSLTIGHAQTETYSGVVTVDNATARKIAVGAWCVGNAGHDACTNASADVATNDLFVIVEGNTARWWSDGSVPTAAVGNPLGVGVPLTLHGHANIVNFTVISTAAGGSTVSVNVGRP